MKNQNDPAKATSRHEALKLSALIAVGVAFTFASERHSNAFATPPMHRARRQIPPAIYSLLAS